MTCAHHTTASTPATVTLSKRPLWSQEALQRAEPCRPVRDFLTDPVAARLLDAAATAQTHAENMRDAGRIRIAETLEARAKQSLAQIDRPDRTCTLVVPTNPDDTDDYSVLPAPDLAAAAAWLYHTPVPLPESALAQLLTAGQLKNCRSLLTQINDALLNRTDQAHAELAAILQTGLEQRLGSSLVGPAERIYRYLLATRAVPDHVRVCESCGLVFKAPRARQCLGCRRSPARPTPRPWHHTITLPDRRPGQIQRCLLTGETGTTVLAACQLTPSGKITYSGRCCASGCEREFTSHDARRRYCDQCAAPAGRTARHRTLEPAEVRLVDAADAVDTLRASTDLARAKAAPKTPKTQPPIAHPIAHHPT